MIGFSALMNLILSNRKFYFFIISLKMSSFKYTWKLKHILNRMFSLAVSLLTQRKTKRNRPKCWYQKVRKTSIMFHCACHSSNPIISIGRAYSAKIKFRSILITKNNGSWPVPISTFYLISLTSKAISATKQFILIPAKARVYFAFIFVYKKYVQNSTQ